MRRRARCAEQVTALLGQVAREAGDAFRIRRPESFTLALRVRADVVGCQIAQHPAGLLLDQFRTHDFRSAQLYLVGKDFRIA